MKRLFTINVVTRSLILWLLFMLIMWSVFALGWATHPQAWNSGIETQRETGWQVLRFVLWHNLLLITLIAAGNLFARFGSFTPGLVVLAWQAVAIGWTAGTNNFMEPFPTVSAANEAFLRIGLWETTAYVLICAVTLTKSLFIADTFPAKKWIETRRLRDLRFSLADIMLTCLGFISLMFAAVFEAFPLQI